MKEKITIGLLFKRTKITIDVHVREHVIARHRSMAGACGLDGLDAYFEEMIGSERLEDALDYVVNPFFSGFSVVEFTQELFDVVFGGVIGMPWGDETNDMSEAYFHELVENWALTFEDVEHQKAIVAASIPARWGHGADVRKLLKPVAEAITRKIIADAEVDQAAGEAHAS